jgi:PAS domain S-box-containing protein
MSGPEDGISTLPSPEPEAFGAAHPLREVLDHLLEGFQVIGPDWTYLYVNPAAAKHGRKTPGELHGRKMWDAYPGIQDSPLFAVLARSMRERTAITFENQFTFPDGTQRWFELRIVPVPEGLCVHSIDIQSRKDAMSALRRLNHELDAQVAHRTRLLKALNEELEAFTYSVSHELRGPVDEVTAVAGRLRERALEFGDDVRLLVGAIVDASSSMRKLIEDLLRFSRLGREPLRKTTVRLTDVVQAAQKQNAPLAAGRHVVWTVGPLPDVQADPALLQLAFSNLFSNALKFTRDRSTARIEVTAESDEVQGEVVVTVRDNGIGFDRNAANRLFGVFQRLHGDAFEGSGIGLATTRRIVARHGGRVWADGSADAGASFHVALPA